MINDDRKQYFVFRLDRLKIENNREIGPAEIKVIPLVSDVGRLFGGVRGYFDADRDIVSNGVNAIVRSSPVISASKIRDGAIVEFGDTGCAVYRADVIPDFFDFSMLVVETDDDVRRIGESMSRIMDAPGFGGFLTNIAAIISTGMTAGVGIAIARFVFEVVSNELSLNRDDSIGVVHQSFNRFEHYPHGRRIGRDIPDVTENMKYDYTIFGFDIPPHPMEDEASK